MKNSKVVLSACLFFVAASLFPVSAVENAGSSGENAEIAFDAASLNEDSVSFFGGWTGEWNERKHPFVALSGALGFNLLLSTWNRYMIGSGWAKTGWEEWDHFWEREMSWDRDWYWTNFFLHPYQGSMYYMASRGANLNQLESFLITALGSYTWEFLCETNAPSKNDMVFTSVGSFCVGEMFYRLSIEAEEISNLLKIAVNPQRLWTEYVWRINQKKGGRAPGHGNIHSLSLGVEVGNVNAGVHLILTIRLTKPFRSLEWWILKLNTTTLTVTIPTVLTASFVWTCRGEWAWVLEKPLTVLTKMWTKRFFTI